MNILSILTDLAVTLVLGVAGIVFAGILVGLVPCVIGKAMKCLHITLYEESPWKSGSTVILIGCLLWLVGTAVRIIIGL